MCGRTRLSVPPSDLADVFQAKLGPAAVDDALNLNCAPTDPVLVVRLARDSRERELVLMRWGLVPFYVHEFRDAKPIINARVETVATSRAFRDAFKKRRCLILADGFYEWLQQSAPRKKKLPHLVQRPDHTAFAMAGLWDRWKGAPGVSIETCTIITRPPVGEVAQLHDRMPVALDARDHTAWLDPATEPPRLHDILDHAIADWVVTPITSVPDSSRKKQLRLFASALDK